MTAKELAQACELAFNSVEQLSKEAKEREKGIKTMIVKKHTPVKWVSHGCTVTTETVWKDGNKSGDEWVAQTYQEDSDAVPSDEQIANADLIVKAVNNHEDLIQALRECITEEGSAGMQEGLGRMKRRLLAINEIAKSAIAKAQPEGRS